MQETFILDDRCTCWALDDYENNIDEFVSKQVTRRGLDERTARAYRLDLDHLYRWLREHGRNRVEKTAIEDYLNYILNERRLKYSTVTRKYRVFRYYLEYITCEKEATERCSIVCPSPTEKEEGKKNSELSRKDIDSFFRTLNREYETLDSDFRRRVCLRDSVMMELLFYHGLEISELLRLEVSDYNHRTGVLFIRGKKGKGRTEYLFSRELRMKLEQWIEEHGCFERENEYHNVLFLSKIGKPLSMKMVILVFEKYRKLAGIESESTPKDLKCSMKRYAREMLMERCS